MVKKNSKTACEKKHITETRLVVPFPEPVSTFPSTSFYSTHPVSPSIVFLLITAFILGVVFNIEFFVCFLSLVLYLISHLVPLLFSPPILPIYLLFFFFLLLSDKGPHGMRMWRDGVGNFSVHKLNFSPVHCPCISEPFNFPGSPGHFILYSELH